MDCFTNLESDVSDVYDVIKLLNEKMYIKIFCSVKKLHNYGFLVSCANEKEGMPVVSSNIRRTWESIFRTMFDM